MKLTTYSTNYRFADRGLILIVVVGLNFLNSVPVTAFQGNQESETAQRSEAQRAVTKPKRPDKVIKSENEWRQLLTPEQYSVTRQQGTEQPFSGKHWNNKKKGTYTCVCCGNPLFDSASKFKSGTGWPSYFQPIDKKATWLVLDYSGGVERIEVTCGRCDAHLGHVFEDGPQPTGKRYCMNSVALNFKPKLAKVSPTNRPNAGLALPDQNGEQQFGQASAEALGQAIEAAIKEKSLAKYLGCTCWERIPNSNRRHVQQVSAGLVARKLESLKVIKTDDYSVPNGFELNVKFRGFIEVRFENAGGNMRLPFGEDDGRFYLASFVRAGELTK